MATCFFFPLIELQFWTQLSVSLIVRQLRPGTRTVLLRPDHPRMRGRFAEPIASAFDEVIELPWVQPRRDWLREFRRCRAFVETVRGVHFPEDSILFGSDWGELAHLLLCRALSRGQGRRRPVIVSLQGFADVDVDKLVVDVRGTLLRNLFTLPLARAGVVAYKHPQTGLFMHHRTPAMHDMQVSLEHVHATRSRLRADNIPFPLRCIDPERVRHPGAVQLPRDCVLVFLDDSVGPLGLCRSEEAYWSAARAILRQLADVVGCERVYVKLHPQSDDASLRWLQGCAFVPLERTVSAEELYLFNRDRISAVVSGASTSLITASWLGIPAFDCSAILTYDPGYLKVYAPYFHPAPMIRRASSMEELRDGLAFPQRERLESCEPCLDRWAAVVAVLEGRLGHQLGGAGDGVPNGTPGQSAHDAPLGRERCTVGQKVPSESTAAVDIQGKRIEGEEVEPLQTSVADPCGMLFLWRGRLLRAVLPGESDRVREIFSTGLVRELVESGLFPETAITDYELEGFGLIVEHRRVSVVSYPFEWSFSMLKDAALTVLRVNDVAGAYGFETKDGHAYNVVFDWTRPMYVDLGSFQKRPAPEASWRGHEEFVRSFVYSLRLWSEGAPTLARTALANIGDSLSHGEFLATRGWLVRRTGPRRWGVLQGRLFRAKVVLSSLQSGEAGGARSWRTRVLRLLAALGLPGLRAVKLRTVASDVGKIAPRVAESRWATYQDEFVDRDGRLRSTSRFDRIAELLKLHNVRTVVELGGNQGVLSRLLVERGIVESAICSDIDENAVDAMYRAVRNTPIKVLPVLLDSMFPLRSAGVERPARRFRAEAVLALALTHHLTLGRQLRLDFVLERLLLFSRRYAVVEFMPLGLWDGRSGDPVPPWYTVKWFREGFGQHCTILHEELLEENRVLFFGEVLPGPGARRAGGEADAEMSRHAAPALPGR